jgi:beta-glucosidase-like glycosyl hydrolase
MERYYACIIARLNGEEIKTRYAYYRALVRKGIGGFIVFGGELETVRKYLERLQDEADLPLIIAADLERGLGQQLKGGTLFPPAMALASAVKRQKTKGQKTRDKYDLNLFRKTCKAIALEARYAGINTIFAPVLDINTNPKNPIIAVRAFGEDADTVSLLGSEMIRTFQRYGIAACGKHFPGHGDSSVDSHITLPLLKQTSDRLKRSELRPFQASVAAGVRMIMMGHLSVPALDPSGIAVSLSVKAVQFVRRYLGYKGIVVTDALNMGGIGTYSEEEAACMAIKAGVDILLHPSDPDKIASYLRRGKCFCNAESVRMFRTGMMREPGTDLPPFGLHQRLSDRLAEQGIRVSGDVCIQDIPLIVILSDEKEEKGATFVNELRRKFPCIDVYSFDKTFHGRQMRSMKESRPIVAVFSDTRAWKGGTGNWLFKALSYYRNRAKLFISFGSPYLLDGLEEAPRMYVYWDSDSAQKAAARTVLHMTA